MRPKVVLKDLGAIPLCSCVCLTLSISHFFPNFSFQLCCSLLTFADIRFCTALSRSRHSISIRRRSRLSLGCCNSLDSFLFQPFFCRFAAVFGLIVLLVTQFGPGSSCRVDGHTILCGICWYTGGNYDELNNWTS